MQQTRKVQKISCRLVFPRPLLSIFHVWKYDQKYLALLGFSPMCAIHKNTGAAPQTLKYAYFTERIQIAVYIVRINENGLLSASAIIITTTNWRGGFKPSHLLLHCKTEFTPGHCFHFHPKLQALSQVLTKVHVRLQTTAVLQDCKVPGSEQPDILIQLPSNFKTML